jgi:hypothetical protein
MNSEAIEKIANAVLYEGYMLYPYRASSVKNQQRFNFGVLYPEGFDTSLMQTECLVQGDGPVDIKIRYLRVDAAQQAHEHAEEIKDLDLPALLAAPRLESFDIGQARLTASEIAHDLYRFTVFICNTVRIDRNTAREDALRDSMISVHTILTAHGGSFISLLDPPEELKAAATACRNIGTWPVLVGEDGSHDAMLSSPIILYDYPQIAPESPGNLFDGTEIDEILTLRIMTLTDDEKNEIRLGDERARVILERTESLPPEQLMKLHGALRGIPRPGPELRKGDRVRLRPRRSADIFDVVLKGKIATVDSVEEDFEGNTHIAVVIDDDPGRDLGELRQPGHRFFFGPEEMELVAEAVAP